MEAKWESSYFMGFYGVGFWAKILSGLLLALWSCSIYLISLCFSFLICKIKISIYANIRIIMTIEPIFINQYFLNLILALAWQNNAELINFRHVFWLYTYMAKRKLCQGIRSQDAEDDITFLKSGVHMGKEAFQIPLPVSC